MLSQAGVTPSSTAPEPSSVLGDELDAGCFQGADNDIQGRGARLRSAPLKLAHCHYPYAGCKREVLLRPID